MRRRGNDRHNPKSYDGRVPRLRGEDKKGGLQMAIVIGILFAAAAAYAWEAERYGD